MEAGTYQLRTFLRSKRLTDLIAVHLGVLSFEMRMMMLTVEDE